MKEVWLKANNRLAAAALIAVPVALAFAALAAAMALRSESIRLFAPALLLLVVGILLLWLGMRLRRPRIVCHSGELLLDVGQAAPLAVPLEAVECFLMGRSPTFLPGKQHADTETITFIVRLRDNDESLSRREIDRRIGAWCGHHVTLRGTWCEPISVELVNRLNARLVEEQKRGIPRKAS